jgi:hypothetical protein
MAFNPFDSIGRAVKTQANRAIGDLVNQAEASVQQFVGNNLRTGVNFIDNAINNVASDLFSSFGFAKAGRSTNLPQATTGKVKTPTTAAFSTATKESDWRVKLSIPPTMTNAQLIAPLHKTGGFCFPYTPTIIISHSANYNSLSPVHTNYPFQIYDHSVTDDIVITGEFNVENAAEGQYWVACIHYLRSVSKMFYGGEDNAGAPPPAVKLSGYGDYVFNRVPCVVSNFTVDLPADVDYIAVPLAVNIGEDEDGATMSNTGTTWVPVQSQISVTLKPTYSRRRVSEFDLNKFVNGNYLNSGQGFI